MARASSKSTAKTGAAAEAPEASPANGAPPKDNRGRELLELRVRWKVVNEMVEAGLAERKRLREAIDALANDMKQARAEE